MARADDDGVALETEDDFSLSNLLRTIGSGQFHEDATMAMQSLIREMERVSRATGGTPKGQLVITMKFKQDRGIMEIEPTFRLTSPSPTRARSILFLDGKGNLSRHNNDQRSLPLDEKRVRDVPMPPVKTVAVPSVEERSVGDVRDIRSRQSNDR
jgi:hypothetical protein